MLEDTPEGRKAVRFIQQRQASGEYRGLTGERRHAAMKTDLEFARIMLSNRSQMD